MTTSSNKTSFPLDQNFKFGNRKKSQQVLSQKDRVDKVSDRSPIRAISVTVVVFVQEYLFILERQGKTMMM